MVDVVSVVTVAVAVLASAFTAWVIGAGSSGATPFAPAVGANAISVLRAGFLVGLLGFLGAALQGASVSEAVGGELVAGVALSPVAVVVVLVLGAGLMAAGIYTGYPIATAFTVTGGVVGAGLALGGDPAWAKYRTVALVWLLTPPLGGGVAYALASVLPRDDVPEDVSVPLLGGLVGAVVANVDFALLGPADGGAALAAVAAAALPGPSITGRLVATAAGAAGVFAVVRWDVKCDQRRGLDRFLLSLGGLVAFSAGGSQVGLAVGPLLPMLDGGPVPTTAVLVGGGFGILVGSWMGSPRMIKALARDYSSLGPRRSISALVPSFVVAQVAILLGVPISFNEIIVSAIVGSGLAVGGREGTSFAKLGRTALAWAGSLLFTLVVGYAVVAIAVPPA